MLMLDDSQSTGLRTGLMARFSRPEYKKILPDYWGNIFVLRSFGNKNLLRDYLLIISLSPERTSGVS